MTRAEWTASVLTPARTRAPERAPVFLTPSGRVVDVIATPDDLANVAGGDDGGARDSRLADEPPRQWIVHAPGGAGIPATVNVWYRQMVEAGASGLGVVGDEATRAGRDPDATPNAGDVGISGVSLASTADVLELFDGIDLRAVSVSLAVDAPAPMLFALVLAAAERRQVRWDALRGTLQHDILGAGILGDRGLFPVAPAQRLVCDTMAFCLDHVPQWSAVSVNGQRTRARGATVPQELSYVLALATTYIDAAVAAGIDATRAAACMAGLFGVEDGVFEELARFRAVRPVWARVMRDRFGVAADQAPALRIHAHMADAGIDADPSDHLVRTVYRALSAALGGVDGLQATSADAAAAASAIEAATLGLRTQQVLAFENGLAGCADPLGGAWFVEQVTKDLADGARADLDALDRLGGVTTADGRAALLARLEPPPGTGSSRVVASMAGQASRAGQALARERAGRVAAVRRSRDGRAATAAIAALQTTARGHGNTMAALVACARADVTLGEMCTALQDVWGRDDEADRDEPGAQRAGACTVP
ncbi:MAG: hypothetical protein ABS36_10100 [Acidobacteria bacterium SCN 69-37]|nr:MAG: hypothetical protein ABS36_10100 [Acidobacteria bacterium SCN 69-37]